MEMEDILQIIESTQKATSPSKGKEIGRGDADARIYYNCENTLPMDHPIQQGRVLQQEIIFTDSTVSNKHKKNKSYEDAMTKSPKTGEKNPCMLILLEPFVQLKAAFYSRIDFYSVFANSNNKIWCFAKFGIDIQIIQDHSQFLHVKVSSGILARDIFCTFIYAKCNRNPRRVLWEELVRLSSQNVPWLVGGNFNVILHPNENQGGDMRRVGLMDDFNNMMLDTSLIDTGFEGEPFTWTNKRIWRRLDRVLYSKEWAEIFNITRVIHLSRRLSAHHPLCIEASKIENKKPLSFKFQNIWLHHHSFL
ncbi:UNVERIFIED_CONTAM: hypothetical protein Slati_3697600 [Sesamum latifolium]|uniref:Endonuclease/exonuclease/phosphatase domain-containing protein n=1 Tax=Sesamum latifolium TaxID=2727402 RepID=A0AAW2U2N5_9LAMI